MSIDLTMVIESTTFSLNLLLSLVGLWSPIAVQPTVKTVGYYLSSLTGLIPWPSLMGSLKPITLPLVAIALCLLIPGCGYRMGHGFEPEIQSVYVPIFESQSDRRGLEFQLTEAVQKQIQSRTPFRIVDQPAADTQLIGKIVSTRKRVLGETRNDDPRELQMSLTVEVRWENLKTGEILAQKRVPLSPNEIQLITRSEFAPEVGQSLATSYQQMMDRMAREIVDLMEAPTL